MIQNSINSGLFDLRILTHFCMKNDLFFGRGGATNRGGVQPPSVVSTTRVVKVRRRLLRRYESSNDPPARHTCIALR